MTSPSGTSTTEAKATTAKAPEKDEKDDPKAEQYPLPELPVSHLNDEPVKPEGFETASDILARHAAETAT